MGKLRQLPKKQASTSGEVIGYLYEKASYWLYERQNRYRARAYAARLERLIRGHGDSGKNVLHSDCLALIAETRADWPTSPGIGNASCS